MLNKNNGIVACITLCISIIFFAFHGILSQTDKPITLGSMKNAGNRLFSAILNTSNILHNSPILNQWNIQVKTGLDIADKHASTFPVSKPLLTTIEQCETLTKWINTIIERNKEIGKNTRLQINDLTGKLNNNIKTLKSTNFYLNSAQKENAKKICIIIGTYLIEIAQALMRRSVKPTTVSREQFNKMKEESNRIRQERTTGKEEEEEEEESFA